MVVVNAKGGPAESGEGLVERLRNRPPARELIERNRIDTWHRSKRIYDQRDVAGSVTGRPNRAVVEVYRIMENVCFSRVIAKKIKYEIPHCFVIFRKSRSGGDCAGVQKMRID